jgi:YesN/AraC family two-component response regulator
MNKDQQLVTETLLIKNMVSNCCLILLKERLVTAGITVHDISLGSVSVSFYKDKITFDNIRSVIQSIGLDVLESREQQIVEQIKIAVIELIHHMNNVDSIVRKADYLVEKLGYSFAYLSRLFSSSESITLEKYIILQKIERIKELILSEEFTLSEIAFMMDYSSVQYLSSQFKKITGVSVSEFKNSPGSHKNPIENIL